MDVNRDHLYRDFESVPEKFRKDVVPVPEHLQEAAEAVLDGKDDAPVKGKTSEARRLLEFSQKEREKRKSKRQARKKAQKKARRSK